VGLLCSHAVFNIWTEKHRSNAFGSVVLLFEDPESGCMVVPGRNRVRQGLARLVRRRWCCGASKVSPVATLSTRIDGYSGSDSGESMYSQLVRYWGEISGHSYAALFPGGYTHTLCIS